VVPQRLRKGLISMIKHPSHMARTSLTWLGSSLVSEPSCAITPAFPASAMEEAFRISGDSSRRTACIISWPLKLTVELPRLTVVLPSHMSREHEGISTCQTALKWDRESFYCRLPSATSEGNTVWCM